jgi:transposase InsO family protein
LSSSKWHYWKQSYGKVHEHNGWIPRDYWLEEWEKRAIVEFRTKHPLEGYRSLTFMMLDFDIVAVSPSSVYRVLKTAGLLQRWNRKVSKKGTGFKQPLHPHEHWHVDICYVNICCTFYYLCSILDGCSRFIVHWEIRQSMTEADVEVIVQRAREHFPDVYPRIISDNGPPFVAKDFKEFIRMSGHRLTIRRATARLSAGTRHSKANASGPELPSRWQMRRDSSGTSSSTTIPTDCTAPSAILPPRTSLKVRKRRFSKNETANSKMHDNKEKSTAHINLVKTIFQRRILTSATN